MARAGSAAPQHRLHLVTGCRRLADHRLLQFFSSRENVATQSLELHFVGPFFDRFRQTKTALERARRRRTLATVPRARQLRHVVICFLPPLIVLKAMPSRLVKVAQVGGTCASERGSRSSAMHEQAQAASPSTCPETRKQASHTSDHQRYIRPHAKRATRKLHNVQHRRRPKH